MRITELWRYPVKSLAGEALSSVAVEHAGLAFDRRYAIIDCRPLREGKTLTSTQNATMLSYRAVVRDDNVVVTAPTGRRHRWDDPELEKSLAALLQQPIALAESEAERFFDQHTILMVSAASLRALGEEWQATLDGQRFRPNIVIDGTDLAPFVETTWQQARFNAGGAAFEAVELCERCVVPTIDPKTLERRPDLLRLLVQKHATYFGLYCRVSQTGDIHVGDTWKVVR
ncbi:MAG: MOSC domain-containing protein [Candidatus Eremiobacteraeota bacterium]|nr:MOSC domain-containing protein [Candidatus Eremiobacteraeota bacterium]